MNIFVSYQWQKKYTNLGQDVKKFKAVFEIFVDLIDYFEVEI